MWKKRLLAVLLTAALCLGLLPGTLAQTREPGVSEAGQSAQPAAAVDLTQLVNIAPLTRSFTHTDSVGNASGTPSNLVDGNYKTEYQFYGAAIPAGNEGVWLQMDLGKDYSVGGVEFAVKSSNDTFYYLYDVQVKGDRDANWTTLTTNEQGKHNENPYKQFALPALTDVRNVKVTLRRDENWTGITPWPAMAEIKIFGELPNIANLTQTYTGTTPVGNVSGTTANLVDGDYKTEYQFYGAAIPAGEEGVWLQMDLGQDYPVGGVEFAVEPNNDKDYYYLYDVQVKGEKDADWTTLTTDEQGKHTVDPIKRFALPALTDVRYVKVTLRQDPGWTGTTPWPSIAEIGIFGVADSQQPEYDGLVNISSLCTVSVPSAKTANPKENIIDGRTGTLWVASSGSWPSTVQLTLPGTIKVGRIEMDFEDLASCSMDVRFQYATNFITSDLNDLLPSQSVTCPMVETYVWEGAELMSNLFITLSNPLNNGQPGSFWPAIAEVRVFMVDEQVDLDADCTELTAGHGEVTKESNTYTVDFGGNQQIRGFRLEMNEGTGDFTYSIQGKLKRGDWTTYVSDAAGTQTEQVLDYTAGMSMVRLVLTGAAASQVKSFRIYGNDYVEPATDRDSIAFEKPTHSNFNTSSSYLITDGDITSGWTADMYPVYVDIDLEQNYNVDRVEVYTPTGDYTQYSVYASMNGRDFDLIVDKQSKDPGTLQGDSHTLQTPKEARIIRVYLEYSSVGGNNTSLSHRPTLNEVRVFGTATGTPVQELPELNITKYEDTAYAKSITETETVNEVQGIISRQVGAQYVDWFTFALAEDAVNHYDYFTLSDEGGKIKVTGNNGVSLATGVNHYLKYFCNVNISQVGLQTAMPASIVPIGAAPVHKETKFPVRYAYNYCTHSYTMAFWGEDEWRNEIDWLALNGVNVVLDITGQEIVWLNFLMELGYTHQEAKDFLAGPGYYAWAYMDNLSGFGGPVHDSYLENQTAMAQKNQHAMRVLGMEPVLEGYCGMVPPDIVSYAKGEYAVSSNIVLAQGGWNAFVRPSVLNTADPAYAKYAQLFYDCQKEIYGDAKYYATDFFHEGGNSGSLNMAEVSVKALDSLLEFDADAVWIIQSWQWSWNKNDMLRGLREPTDRRDHALILDLWAEHDPHWNQANSSYGSDVDGDGLVEFSDTPWVYCMLNNFGGRMGLHGHLDTLATQIPAAANQAKHMVGIGMTPEGDGENPLLYDFLFETIWTQDAGEDLPVIDLDQWLTDYARRRYGADSQSAEKALGIMAETVYKSSLNMRGQGSPESVVNSRPALSIGAASTWGNAVISYDKLQLEKAAKLLLEDYSKLSSSDAYLYDLADVLKQVLSNTAQDLHGRMASAFSAGDAEQFEELSAQFLKLIDMVDQVLSTRREFLFGTWTTNASELAADADDFTARLFLRNAKALVTTWGSFDQCETGKLKDYSNRQWAGLTQDFYKERWVRWIDACKEALENGSTANPSLEWFAWEWEYVRDGKAYPNTPDTSLSLRTLGKEILSKYSLMVPAADDSFDVPVSALSIHEVGNEETASEQGGAANVLDGDSGTIWHSNYSGVGDHRGGKYIIFKLADAALINGLRYQPRQTGGENGIVTEYKIEVSADGSAWQTVVESGAWVRDRTWKMAKFEAVEAQYVRFTVLAGVNNYASASEIRIMKKDPLKELLNVLEDARDPEDPADKLAMLEDVDTALLKETLGKDEDVTAAVTALENAMGVTTNVVVESGMSASFTQAQVSVLGAALNITEAALADATPTATLTIDSPADDFDYYAGAGHQYTAAVPFSMSLTNAEAELRVPVQISLPIPAAFAGKTEQLVIFHRHDGKVERVDFRVEDTNAVFTLDGFSDFLMASLDNDLYLTEYDGENTTVEVWTGESAAVLFAFQNAAGKLEIKRTAVTAQEKWQSVTFPTPSGTLSVTCYLLKTDGFIPLCLPKTHLITQE